MQSIAWLVVFVLLIGFEAATMGLFTVWFAGGALVAFLVSLFTENLLVQLVVFLVISFLFLYFTRPVAVRYINSKRIKTNIDALAGKEARVTETIDNFKGTGTATLDGLEWTARSEEDGQVISAGERVTVKGVKGVKLIVAKYQEMEEAVSGREPETQQS